MSRRATNIAVAVLLCAATVGVCTYFPPPHAAPPLSSMYALAPLTQIRDKMNCESLSLETLPLDQTNGRTGVGWREFWMAAHDCRGVTRAAYHNRQCEPCLPVGYLYSNCISSHHNKYPSFKNASGLDAPTHTHKFSHPHQPLLCCIQ